MKWLTSFISTLQYSTKAQAGNSIQDLLFFGLLMGFFLIYLQSVLLSFFAFSHFTAEGYLNRDKTSSSDRPRAASLVYFSGSGSEKYINI